MAIRVTAVCSISLDLACSLLLQKKAASLREVLEIHHLFSFQVKLKAEISEDPAEQ